MEAKTSHAKSDVSDTIDNFIKAEQKEVRFVNVYEKISKFKLNSSRKGMPLQRWSDHARGLRMPHLQRGRRPLRFLLSRMPQGS